MRALLIDIGGSGLKYAVATDAGTDAQGAPLPPTLADEGVLHGVANSTEAMVAAIRSLWEPRRDQVDAIAICACMVLDTQTGYVYRGGSYHAIEEVNLAELITSACDGTPAVLESDGDCCLRAELRYGSLRGCTNAGVVVFGTGLACAFVVDGHLVVGNRAAAGEVSFCAAAHSENGPFWASTSGMAAACARLAEREGLEPGSLTGVDLFQQVEQGDERASTVLDEMCDESALQIYNLCLAFAPERLAIGGGISRQPELMRRLLPRVEGYFERIRSFTACRCPELVTARFYNTSNLLGAWDRLIWGA